MTKKYISRISNQKIKDNIWKELLINAYWLGYFSKLKTTYNKQKDETYKI